MMVKPLFVGSEWDIPLIERMWSVIDDIGRNTFGMDYYDPQIEIITAEQMLNCYAARQMGYGEQGAYISSERRP